MTSSLRLALAVLAPVVAAVAQVPIDHALVVVRPPDIADPAFRIVDTRPGGGTTAVRNQRVFVPIQSAAVDPANGGAAFFATDTSSLGGTWEMVLIQERIDSSRWGVWARTGALRVEVGPNGVVSLLPTGAVSLSPRAGGGETVLATSATYVDVDIDGRTVFALDRVGGRVDALDVTGGSSRVVGRYAGATALAVMPSGQLVLGSSSGDLTIVDPTSGAVVSSVPTGRGAIVAVSATSADVPIFATSGAAYSALDVSRPLLTSRDPILDLDVGLEPSAAVLRFGEPCAVAGRLARFGVAGLPAVGNANFRAPVGGGAPNAAAALVVGASRLFSPTWNVQLPFDLGPIGGGEGCALLTDPAVVVGQALDPVGAATVPLAVPNDPGLRGQILFAQWLLVDAGTGALGVSDAATWVLR